MRGRRRIARAVGVAMVCAGVVLLLGVGAFYGYALYSSTQLDDLNASIEGNVSLPNGAISLNAATSSEAKLPATVVPDSEEARVTHPADDSFEPARAAIDAPLPAGSPDSIGAASDTPAAAVIPAPTAQAASEDAQATRKRVPLPVASYASIYPGFQIHPKYWGQPAWAGADPYSYGESAGLDGFQPISASAVVLRGQKPSATRIRIPSIEVDSTVAALKVINNGNGPEYETPKNLVGHIPTTANPGESGNGWFFAHLESPLKGEGNEFHRLPEIPRLLRNGDPVYVTITSDAGEYLYQAVASRVVHQNELRLYDTGGSTITLVTCSNRPLYDHRQLVTARLIGFRPSGG